MRTQLLPSYPAPNYHELERMLIALQGIATSFQIDFVDGDFAQPKSWPYTEHSNLDALKQLAEWTEHYQLEFDLMVARPELLFSSLATLQASRVVLHLESLHDIEATIIAAEQFLFKIDLAITNDTPVTAIEPYITNHPNLGLQTMGIKTVGEQGQPFDERTLHRVRELRAMYPELQITVDGAVNFTTIPLLYAAGATRFAPGSALTKADDPVLAYKQLLSLIA